MFRFWMVVESIFHDMSVYFFSLFHFPITLYLFISPFVCDFSPADGSGLQKSADSLHKWNSYIMIFV